MKKNESLTLESILAERCSLLSYRLQGWCESFYESFEVVLNALYSGIINGKVLLKTDVMIELCVKILKLDVCIDQNNATYKIFIYSAIIYKEKTKLIKKSAQVLKTFSLYYDHLFYSLHGVKIKASWQVVSIVTCICNIWFHVSFM